MAAVQETVDRVRQIDVDQYRYGFETIIESDKAPKGLSEDIVRFISAKKTEPAWMLEWPLEASPRWLARTGPPGAPAHVPTPPRREPQPAAAGTLLAGHRQRWREALPVLSDHGVTEGEGSLPNALPERHDHRGTHVRGRPIGPQHHHELGGSLHERLIPPRLADDFHRQR